MKQVSIIGDWQHHIARKDSRGVWRQLSECRITAPEGQDATVQWGLRVVTRKMSSGGIVTAASVISVGDGFETHRVFQDFYQVLQTAPNARVTVKAVAKQHEANMDEDDLLGWVTEWYAEKAKEAAK